MNTRTSFTAAACGLIAVLTFCFVMPPSALAQDPGDAAPVVDPAVLKRKIQEVNASDSLDKTRAATLLDLYRKTLANLDQISADSQAADEYAAAAKTAPAETARLQKELDKPVPNTADSLQIPNNASAADIELALTKEKAALAALESKLSDIRKQRAAESARPAAAHDRLIEIERAQDATVAEIKAAADSTEDAEVAQARRWLLETRALAQKSETRKLNQELQSQQVRLDLLDAQRAATERSLASANARIQALENLQGARRRTEAARAQQAAATAREAFAGGPPAVAELAQQNAQLGNELAQIAEGLDRVAAEEEHARNEATRIEDALSSAKDKLSIVGLSPGLGHILIAQRRSLPDLDPIRKQVKSRPDEIARTALQLLQLSEERGELLDMNAYVAARTAGLTPQAAAQAGPDLRKLAEARRKLVHDAADFASERLRELNAVDLAQRRLIDVVETYDEYLEKHLLWMRSVAPIEFDFANKVPEDLKRMLSLSNWAQFARDLAGEVVRSKPTALLLAILVAFAFLRHRFVALLAESSTSIWRAREDKLMFTVKALVYTGLAVIPGPLLFIAVGWTIDLAPDPAQFSAALGQTLMIIGTDWLVIALFIGVARENGVALRHFRWPQESVAMLRHELTWFAAVYLPARFVGFFFGWLDTTGRINGLAAVGGLTAATALGVFVYRLLTPMGGVLQVYLARHPTSLLARLRPLWVLGVCAIVPGLMVLLMTGYTYTGKLIAIYFIRSLWFVGAVVLMNALVVRWLMVVRRRLQFQAAKERLEAARQAAQGAQTEESTASGSEGAVEIEEPQVDFAALDADSRTLLRTVTIFTGVIGLWGIWAGAIPAFDILDEVSLWHYTVTVNGTEQQVWMSLSDLLLAIIVGIATFAAARGIPSIIEILLLQRMSVTAGSRYTTVTLLRYIIVAIGAIAVFVMLGGSWSQIQWLVAALGVGIGFGLQEIVANFVSGLIILFERPIRIGDTVTVGDTSGVVTQIRIRATTITDWDRKELVVPNKEFVTNRLLNWTLTDSINRIVIPVGIAYGSDVAKAMTLAREAAEEHENVVAEPRPFVTFDGFGDNSLNIILRAYIPSLDNRLRTGSDLHEAINRKFADAGIVVSFPQRDIHLDSISPLDIRVHRGDALPD